LVGTIPALACSNMYLLPVRHTRKSPRFFCALPPSYPRSVSVSPLSGTLSNVIHCSHTCDEDVGRMGEESTDPGVPGSLSNHTASVVIRWWSAWLTKMVQHEGRCRNGIWDNRATYGHCRYIVVSESHPKHKVSDCCDSGIACRQHPGSTGMSSIDECGQVGVGYPVSRNNGLRGAGLSGLSAPRSVRG